MLKKCNKNDTIRVCYPENQYAPSGSHHIGFAANLKLGEIVMLYIQMLVPYRLWPMTNDELKFFFKNCKRFLEVFGFFKIIKLGLLTIFKDILDFGDF